MAYLCLDFKCRNTFVLTIGATVFKVKLNFHISTDQLSDSDHHDLVQVIRAVVTMESFHPVSTRHFIIYIHTAAWDEVEHYEFLKYDRPMQVHSHMYVLDVYKNVSVTNRNPAPSNSLNKETPRNKQARHFVTCSDRSRCVVAPSPCSSRYKTERKYHGTKSPSVPVRVLEPGKWSFVNGQYQTKPRSVIGIATPTMKRTVQDATSRMKYTDPANTFKKPGLCFSEALALVSAERNNCFDNPRQGGSQGMSYADTTAGNALRRPTPENELTPLRKFSDVYRGVKRKDAGRGKGPSSKKQCLRKEESSGIQLLSTHSPSVKHNESKTRLIKFPGNQRVGESPAVNAENKYQHRRYKSVVFKSHKKNSARPPVHVQLDRHLVEENEMEEDRKLHKMAQKDDKNASNDSWLRSLVRHIVTPVKKLFEILDV